MINNYAKDRVISPVKGKKYTKEQIIQILFVYTLKGTLSIGEIKRILDGAYSIAEKNPVKTTPGGGAVRIFGYEQTTLAGDPSVVSGPKIYIK